MIIVCPECSGPYELQDERIAALVQLECPHCSYGVILDFAAANDPSLIEEGMQMASGFRSAVDYRASLAPAAKAPLRPVEEPAAAVPEPIPEPAVPEPIPEPVPEPIPATRRAAARRAARPAARTAPGGTAPTQPRPARTGRTHVGPMPGPPGQPEQPGAEIELEADAEPESVPTVPIQEPAIERGAPSAPAREPAQAEAAADARETVEVDEPPGEEPAARVQERPVPHTPPAPRAATAVAESGPQPVEPSPADSAELEVPRGNPAGTFLLAVLVLLAVALVGASVALEGTPDPRPLLENVLRKL